MKRPLSGSPAARRARPWSIIVFTSCEMTSKFCSVAMARTSASGCRSGQYGEDEKLDGWFMSEHAGDDVLVEIMIREEARAGSWPLSGAGLRRAHAADQRPAARLAEVFAAIYSTASQAFEILLNFLAMCQTPGDGQVDFFQGESRVLRANRFGGVALLKPASTDSKGTPPLPTKITPRGPL